MLPKALLEMDINELFTPEEQKYLLAGYDNSIPDDGPMAFLKDPDTTLNEKLLFYATGLKEEYERNKIDKNDLIAKSILKKIELIWTYFDDGSSGLALKQQTLKRISKIENNYFTKQDAIELRQDIVDNDKVAKTDTILASQGEIKIFENVNAFEDFKQNISSNYMIDLTEGVDYTVLEENYYLRTSIFSGGYKAGSNLLEEANLPKKRYLIDYSRSTVSDITTGNPPGINSQGIIPAPPWYWFRVNADQANTRINVYKTIGESSSGQTALDLNSAETQKEFQPKYINVYVIKFLKTLTYKTFLINTNKEQIEEFNEVSKRLKDFLQNYIIEVYKPKLFYIAGQQYTFINQESFNNMLSTLVSDVHIKTPATVNDVEINKSTVEGSTNIFVVPKVNLYYIGDIPKDFGG